MREETTDTVIDERLDAILERMAAKIKFDRSGPSGLEIMQGQIAGQAIGLEIANSDGFTIRQEARPLAKAAKLCAYCRGPISQVVGRGRPRKTCSDACRKSMSRKGLN